MHFSSPRSELWRTTALKSRRGLAEEWFAWERSGGVGARSDGVRTSRLGPGGRPRPAPCNVLHLLNFVPGDSLPKMSPFEWLLCGVRTPGLHGWRSLVCGRLALPRLLLDVGKDRGGDSLPQATQRPAPALLVLIVGLSRAGAIRARESLLRHHRASIGLRRHEAEATRKMAVSSCASGPTVSEWSSSQPLRQHPRHWNQAQNGRSKRRQARADFACVSGDGVEYRSRISARLSWPTGLLLGPFAPSVRPWPGR